MMVMVGSPFDHGRSGRPARPRLSARPWSAVRGTGSSVARRRGHLGRRYLTICPLDLGSFWIDFKTCFLADREPNFSLLVCHHVVTSLFARAFVRPERRNDDLA